MSIDNAVIFLAHVCKGCSARYGWLSNVAWTVTQQQSRVLPYLWSGNWIHFCLKHLVHSLMTVSGLWKLKHVKIAIVSPWSHGLDLLHLCHASNNARMSIVITSRRNRVIGSC